jgi:anti-sigma factor (TIGR02949 family)
MNEDHNCLEPDPHAKHNCRELLESLSDYVDGELSENLCAELERHLTDCTNCRIVVDTLQKTIDLYHAERVPQPLPLDVRDRLFHRLDLDDYKK